MGVRRYEHNGHDWEYQAMVEDEYGDYVQYKDYSVLWVNNLDLQNKYDELKDEHDDLKKTYDKILSKLEEVSNKYLSEGELYYMWEDINSYD